MAINYFHQHRERAVKTIDDVLRGARTRSCSKTAEIDEHDGEETDIARRTGAFEQQPLDDLRRNVLTKQVGDAIARRGGMNAGLELAAQLRSDRACEYSADQDDQATRGMIPDFGFGIGAADGMIEHRHAE